jgi:hypothetical protein
VREEKRKEKGRKVTGSDKEEKQKKVVVS